MYLLVNELLIKMGLSENLEIIGNVVTILILLILGFILRFITKSLLFQLFMKLSKQTKYVWNEIVFQNKTLERLSSLSIPILIGIAYERNASPIYDITMKLTGVMGVVFITLFLQSLLLSIDEIYQLYEISKIKPIRGFLQVVRVTVWILGGIIGTAVLLGRNPMVLIGGIGAFTALTSFIFKDAILGFVAGIQLTANDMVRIGDWIELPKYFADGTVVDLTMTTVKIENFDKTITSIPAYILISEAFINWRGMVNCGARRIKRSIYLDPSKIKRCDEEMMLRFQKITLLNDYMESKMMDIKSHNEEWETSLFEPINGRGVTNIGTFRAYVIKYLENHPNIRKDMPLIVRQMAAEDKGLPIEVYAFVNTTNWNDYEEVQSDIFEHLYSIVSVFDLHVYREFHSNKTLG